MAEYLVQSESLTAVADAIRAKLTEMGWSVVDTAKGPQISKL